MRVKPTSLIRAVSVIAFLSVSSTYAAVNVAADGAAKPLANETEIVVAQAWWDAAANAANAQQQVTTRQEPPLVRRVTQRYRR
jgi:hypothetical protein